MSPHAAVAAWTTTLARLANGLGDLERRLDDDEWSGDPAPPVQVPDVAVPVGLAPAARRLLARLTDLEQQLTAELHATSAALAELDARRVAARNYRKSATTASGPERGDDETPDN